MHFITLLSGLMTIVSPVFAAAAPKCQFNSATNPTCWGEYSLSTNWYKEAPNTGRKREYWFDVTNTTLAPDGFPRMVLTVNGKIPGPTIEADWGDTIVVHVKNNLKNNGTSFHWHGIRQLGSVGEDGVASITQCPLAPGDTQTYTWRATQYGTTWYHSHYSLQAWNGVFGGIIIRGPASAPYDEDKGMIILSDWHHRTTDQLYAQASTSGPPPAQNGLINGLNVYGSGGSRFKTKFQSGKSYRLRLVNTAIDNMFKFSIDNHTLTVIAADLVPIKPFQTNMINIGIGQRYDVIVKANQKPGNYWMRSIPQITCGATEMTVNITGIVTYDNIAVADPKTKAYEYVDNCDDVPTKDLVPYVALNAGAPKTTKVMEVGLDRNPVNSFFRWKLNNNTFLSDWGEPTLQKVLNPNATYTPEENIITLTEKNAWTYLVVESQLGLSHPFHLHGHDFWVIGQQAGATYTSTSQLNLKNPPRRDVAMLPPAGFLAIAFQNDNPGVWLAHCHIGWHTSQGFALQLVERSSEIKATVNIKALSDTCVKWNTYQDKAGLEQEDSGVKYFPTPSPTP